MPGKSKKNPLILGFALFFMIIALSSLVKINQQGTFEEPEYRELPCQPFLSVAGPEHFLVSRSGKLLISSQDRQAAVYDQSWPQGAILLADPTTPHTPPRNLTKEFRGEFHPRGISLFEDESGQTLFVVNYLTGGFSIEIFSFDGDFLIHKNSVKSKSLVQPGNIAARDHHSFYVMNEHGLFTASGHFIEEFLGLKASHVLYHDGHEFKKAVENLRLGYGIFFDKTSSQLFVTDMKEKTISVFDHRDPSLTATLKHSLKMDTHPAGIAANKSGEGLLVTAHPQLLQANSHMLDPRQVASPSQVISMDLTLSKTEELMLSQKSGTSAASCVREVSDSLILGGAFDNHMTICSLLAPALSTTTEQGSSIGTL